MFDFPKHQICPYCGFEVDDAYSEWEKGRNVVECDGCKKYYSVSPIYKFIGFLVEKYCDTCGFYEDECEC